MHILVTLQELRTVVFATVFSKQLAPPLRAPSGPSAASRPSAGWRGGLRWDKVSFTKAVPLFTY